MLCQNCNKEFKANEKYCPYCGVSTSIGMGFGNGKKPIELKWFLFMIYLGLFLSALYDIGSGIKYITGSSSTIETLYLASEDLNAINAIYGVFCILMGCFAVFVRMMLAGFNKKGPMCLYLYYIIGIVGFIVYSFSLPGQINPIYHFIRIAIFAVVFALNKIYFKKREELFSKDRIEPWLADLRDIKRYNIGLGRRASGCTKKQECIFTVIIFVAIIAVIIGICICVFRDQPVKYQGAWKTEENDKFIVVDEDYVVLVVNGYSYDAGYSYIYDEEDEEPKKLDSTFPNFLITEGDGNSMNVKIDGEEILFQRVESTEKNGLWQRTAKDATWYIVQDDSVFVAFYCDKDHKDAVSISEIVDYDRQFRFTSEQDRDLVPYGFEKIINDEYDD